MFTYFLFQIRKQNKTGSITGNWYLADHIAKDHTQTDITCNIEEPEQKYRTAFSRILSGFVTWCINSEKFRGLGV